MGTAVTRREIKGELERFAPSYANLLPKGYTPQRLITGALIAIQANPDLAKCSPISIATALGRIAQWGLDVGETAHLIPFGTVCTPSADYKGLIKLMLRAGARKVEAEVVREGDQFHYERGLNPILQHRPQAKPEARITHAYAIAWLRGGDTLFEVMTAEEIDAIRKSKSRSWKNGDLTRWYARKCVTRQLAKWLDKSPELAAVVAHDDQPIAAIPSGATLVDVVTQEGEVLEAQVDEGEEGAA